MFTGIIEGVGKVTSVKHLKHSTMLSIKPPFSSRSLKLGDSIAIDGCCLTVTDRTGSGLSFDVSPETLEKTTLGLLKKGDLVNLERALKIQDRLGGHIVQGHVDGMGTLIKKQILKEGGQTYHVLRFRIPPTGEKYIVPKGSIAIDGISLTVNAVAKANFSVCIVPHTEKWTGLIRKKLGQKVNLEFDILAKYLETLVLKSKTKSLRKK